MEKRIFLNHTELDDSILNQFPKYGNLNELVSDLGICLVEPSSENISFVIKAFSEVIKSHQSMEARPVLFQAILAFDNKKNDEAVGYLKELIKMYDGFELITYLSQVKVSWDDRDIPFFITNIDSLDGLMSYYDNLVYEDPIIDVLSDNMSFILEVFQKKIAYDTMELLYEGKPYSFMTKVTSTILKAINLGKNDVLSEAVKELSKIIEMYNDFADTDKRFNLKYRLDFLDG